LRKTNVDYVKPEQVKAFELGYRSFISDVSVDINGYYNIYNDFIGNLNVSRLIMAQHRTIQTNPGPADHGWIPDLRQYRD
jgi:outer membrane receptor protein involved in Fe transport